MRTGMQCFITNGRIGLGKKYTSVHLLTFLTGHSMLPAILGKLSGSHLRRILIRRNNFWQFFEHFGGRIPKLDICWMFFWTGDPKIGSDSRMQSNREPDTQVIHRLTEDKFWWFWDSFLWPLFRICGRSFKSHLTQAQVSLGPPGPMRCPKMGPPLGHSATVAWPLSTPHTFGLAKLPQRHDNIWRTAGLKAQHSKRSLNFPWTSIAAVRSLLIVPNFQLTFCTYGVDADFDLQ